MESSAQAVWSVALSHLQVILNDEVFRLWFAPIRPLGLVKGCLTLGVNNDFCGVWLGENYRDVIENAVKAATGEPLRITFVPREGATAGASIQRPEKKHSVLSADEEALVRFEPKNTFDSFVAGNNLFAHAAAIAVAQNPGKSYNPLFLFGGVGLGKTHLLHAIGHYVTSHKRGAKVAYVSTERFTNEFIDALQNTRLPKFRRKFRETDVLLIDDIQFLGGKERIQEEFFHTFNALFEARKQIVLTCDRPAAEIHGLEQRLISRFEWGQVADIHPPDMETRLAILRKKAEQMNYALADEIGQFLAERIRTNVRRLEGALTRVASYAQLTAQEMTLERLRDLLRDVLSDESRVTLTIEIIQKRVAEHYDLRLADLLGRRRPEHIAFPRQVAMYLARTLTDSSLSAIGEAFGGRDHGTVLHACRAVANRMETDQQVCKTVNQLERALQG